MHNQQDKCWWLILFSISLNAFVSMTDFEYLILIIKKISIMSFKSTENFTNGKHTFQIQNIY